MKSDMIREDKKSDENFLQYGLTSEIVQALHILGYDKPTQIQKEAIPAILEGKDVVGKSQTGSGKTAAFAIPICEKIKWEENAPQALVLEPTRELAVQVQEEIYQIGRKKRIKVPVVFGGMPVDKQRISLRQKAHIVVATPGRLLDHMRRDNIALHEVRYIVIDEADLMLDMGFLDDVAQIIEAIEQPVSIQLFSATIGEHLDNLIAKYMHNPVKITVESEFETADGLEQLGYEVECEDKFSLFMNLLVAENPKNAMIFCDTREMVNTLYQKMRRKRIRCGMLHGGMEQRDRLYAISDFRKGKFHYLVTTDVAARGIDFSDITHVFQYDFPTKKENYIHRAGRTARNGKTGKVISLITASEKHYQRAVEDYAGIRLTMKTFLSDSVSGADRKRFDDRQREKIVIKEGKGAAFNKSIMKLTISGGKKSKIRPGDVVATICGIDGMTQEDIGIIDVRESLIYVEIFNGKGKLVLDRLPEKTLKGKHRKVRETRER